MKLTLFLILYSCGCALLQTSQNNKTTVKNIGYIKMVDLDSKTYSISTKDKKIYLPLNLESKFKQDRLKVIFEGIIDTSRLRNVRLAGIPLRLKMIKLRCQ